MNIFVTNISPTVSAIEHCDIHLRKMIVEVLQMLSTAHVMLDGVQVVYKKTHYNHPCNVWIRESVENYAWAVEHFKALCQEYYHRTRKVHASYQYTTIISKPPKNISRACGTPFAQAMPVNHKNIHATVAYQSYLNEKFKEWKSRSKPLPVTWTNRKRPSWYTP